MYRFLQKRENMPILESIGANAAGAAIGAGMGLMLGPTNDRRQRKQQARLQEIQIRGQKELTDYQYAKDLQMWKDTNYSAQMEQLKAAGLNPALLYGMSGGGGATMGTGGANVSGANAQQNPGEVQQMAGMGMQLGMNAAQTELIKAQTENIKAETAEKLGWGKENIETKTLDLKAGITNKEALTKLTEVETRIAQLKENIIRATTDDEISKVHEELRKLEGEASQALTKANLDTLARQTRLDQIKADLATTYLTQKVLKATKTNIEQNTAESKQKVRLMEQQIRETINRIMMDWDKMSQTDREILIKKELMSYGTEISNDVVKAIAGGLGRLISGGK